MGRWANTVTNGQTRLRDSEIAESATHIPAGVSRFDAHDRRTLITGIGGRTRYGRTPIFEIDVAASVRFSGGHRKVPE
jgi:hypothetical protein